MWDVQETIVAIGSAPGPAIRGIVRMSGPTALTTLAKVFRGIGSQPVDLESQTGNLSHASSVDGEFTLNSGAALPITALIWPDQRLSLIHI